MSFWKGRKQKEKENSGYRDINASLKPQHFHGSVLWQDFSEPQPGINGTEDT